jgi:hypothetical protein
MKMHRRVVVAVFVVAVAAFVWWCLAPRATPPLSSPAATPEPKVPVADAATPPPKPVKFFRFANNLPTSPEEKAMMDWWMYMDKHDPDFQWKTPIEFYGRVVDQHSEPVVDARVSLVWSGLGETPERKLLSGHDGIFTLTGVNGKGLSVQVGKDGYRGAASSTNRSFEYSAFFEPHYHVPDKDNPVIFRLWKLEDAEPMYFWNKLKKLTVDGQKVWFDTKTGNFGASGDVAFSTKRGATYAPRQFDWSLLIEASPGGGIALSSEELMFEAPKGGYEPSWTQDIGGKDASYTISKGVNFYLKTPDGKYAAIKAEIGHMTIPEGEVNLSAYVNPSGSRNLQYDAKKRLPPK